jgi:hypothetical protein
MRENPSSRVEVETLVQRILDERARKARRRFAAFGGVALAAVAAVLWGGPVLAQGMCTQSLPAPLVTLCPNAPALAGDVNGNFQQLVTWLTQKVGTQGSANVTVTGTTSLQGTTATSLTVSGNQIVNGTSSLNGATTVGGALKANAVGGNVAHNCVARLGTPGWYQAGCAANEVAVGGGGICPNTWRIIESAPYLSTNNNDPVTADGQIPRAWHVACQVWGNAGTYSNPSTLWAICCQE